jgi:Putative Actinobacterial Holin-X, holin superfamily III
MHTPAETPADENGRPGLGEAVKEVSDRAKALVDLEVELASLELKRKVGALGLGVGLFVGAALFAVYALGFAFATIAAGLATFLATWLALLIVTAFLLVVAGILVLVGRGRIRSGTPPVPEQAIEEARLTSAALRGNGS